MLCLFMANVSAAQTAGKQAAPQTKRISCDIDLSGNEISESAVPEPSCGEPDVPAEKKQQKKTAQQKESAGKKAADKKPVYAVVSPIGRSKMEIIKQAPRLKTLSGKTIALVGTSFMAKVTHAEIKRLILKNYPDAKVIMHDEIGGAGMYPAFGTVRRAKDEFQQKLKEMKVDAVISGNGGCGLCTPKETGSAIAAEYVGVPSVMVAAPGFTEQAKYTALNSGVAVLRTAEYPGAFALHTEEELIRNTREKLWPQIVKGLTEPITAKEKSAGEKASKGDIRDDAFKGTYDEVQAYFKEMQWSDGLPVVPPTFDKVNEFMKYAPNKWDETIAVLPVANREIKAWHVAVNAVMSGCKPEYMPILIAMAKGLGSHDFNWTLASTHAWLPFSWLNGPLARQLGIDSGQGQINEYPNAEIGRFMNLAMLNLFGYYVKQTRMGTFGYPMPWCLAEDDAAYVRIGWKPSHVRAGYKLNDNTISLTSALLWGNNMTPSTSDAGKITELSAWDITERGQFALGSGQQFVNRTIMMTEPVAAILSKTYRTVGELEAKLVELARRPVRERSYARYYSNPGGSKDTGQYSLKEFSGHLRKTEGASMTPTSPWQDSPEAEQLTIPVMKYGVTNFLITGDAARNKVQTMPGGGSATIKIELPKNWDALMKNLGYKPLSSYYLKESKSANTAKEQPEINEKEQQAYSYGSSQQNSQGRPNAEQYRQRHQQGNNARNGNSANGQRRPANGQYGNSGANGQRRPSPEQYRKMRQKNKTNGKR